MKKVAIIGSMGLAKEFYSILKKTSFLDGKTFLGFISNEAEGAEVIDGFRIIGNDNMFMQRVPEANIFVAINDPQVRKRLFDIYSNENNYSFPNLIDPSAIIDESNLELGHGNIIASGCIISPSVKLGIGNIINMGCILAHDVELQDFNSLNPGANISGNVHIGNGCTIGAGSIVHQGIKVADETILGLGSVLTRNTRQGTTYVGNPARKFL